MKLELLSELCRTGGGPGREERIREIVIRELEPIVDDIEIDSMGNVIARRGPRGRAAGKGKPRKLMISAHMDEISLMVTHVVLSQGVVLLRCDGLELAVGDRRRGQVRSVQRTQWTVLEEWACPLFLCVVGCRRQQNHDRIGLLDAQSICIG